MVTNANLSVMQPVYQAENEIAGMMKQHHNKALDCCSKHLGRYVRVQTIHGQQFEGTIVNVDAHYVYLSVSQDQGAGHRSPFWNPYAYKNAILPLVLYELLVIALL
jgi:hypothetical protein